VNRLARRAKAADSRWNARFGERNANKQVVSVDSVEKRDALLLAWSRPASRPNGWRVIVHPCPDCGKGSTTTYESGRHEHHCQHCRPDEAGIRLDTIEDFIGAKDEHVTDEERAAGLVPGTVRDDGAVVTDLRGPEGGRIIAEKCERCGKPSPLRIERDGEEYCENCVPLQGGT
jgi:hypothetical protein